MALWLQQAMISKTETQKLMPREQEYICEICTDRFDNIDHLHKHRYWSVVTYLSKKYIRKYQELDQC